MELLGRKLHCGDWGWKYKRKVQNGTAYWICSGDGIAGRHCKTKPLSKEVFFKTFVNFYNRLRAYENLILRNSVTRLSEIKKMVTCMDSEIGDLDRQSNRGTTVSETEYFPVWFVSSLAIRGAWRAEGNKANHRSVLSKKRWHPDCFI